MASSSSQSPYHSDAHYINISPPSTPAQPPDAKKMRSRRAAQSRRLCENNEFGTLAEALPLSRQILSQLDKATVVRLTISYLGLRKFVRQLFDIEPMWEHSEDGGDNAGPPESPVDHQAWNPQAEGGEDRVPAPRERDCADADTSVGTRILEAFEGFLMCLSKDFNFLYVSETISVGLGLSQIDLLGSNLFDYIHEDDRCLADKMLSFACNTPDKLENHVRFSMRMKSSLIKRASRDMEDRSIGYKVVEFFLKPQFVEGSCACDPEEIQGFMAAGVPLPSSFSQDYRLESNCSVITATMDLKIQYSDPRCEGLLSGAPGSGSLLNTSVYRLIHPDDLDAFALFHKQIIAISASSSGYYRMLLSTGAYTWVHSYGLRIQRHKAQVNNQMITLINEVVA